MKITPNLSMFVLFLCIVGQKPATAMGAVKHPFMSETANRTPMQLIQDLRGGRARINEAQFLDRLKRQGFKISFLDELADSARVIIRACDQVFELEYVGSQNEFGTHMRACKPGENTLWFDGRPAVSLYCGNVIHSLIPAPTFAINTPKKCVWKNDPTIIFSTDQGLQPVGGVSLDGSGSVYGGLSNQTSNTRTQSGKTCLPNQ